MSTPIGIFDSGIGGLSVLRHINTILPMEALLYLADQAHVPYGSRTAAEIRTFSESITRFLLHQGAKLIVVACNTATAAALDHLRTTFPEIPFVGMEPAVKPAAAATRSDKVGVLATTSTFASSRYALLMSRFAQNVTVYEDPCTGLVPLIEAGKGDSKETEHLLRQIISPMLVTGVDTLVLGCTHYPFVLPLIKRITDVVAPDQVLTIIDPAPAVARQTSRVLAHYNLLAAGLNEGTIQHYTTAEITPFEEIAGQLLGSQLTAAKAYWVGDQVTSA